MKTKISIFFLLMAAGFTTRSQDMLDMLKKDLNAERRAIVAEVMDIAPEKETEFWSIYTEMENELDVLVDKRAKNIERFAENFTHMTDDVADELAKTYFDINMSRMKLYKKYYKRLSKLLSKKEAARFVQVMDQIQLLINVQIAAETPLIE